MEPLLLLSVVLFIQSSLGRGPPTLLPGALKLAEIQIDENDSIELICPISKAPDQSIQWLKDNEELEPMWTSSTLTIRRFSLKIHRVQLTDVGLYQCNVVNGFGHASASFRLYVKGNSTQNNQTTADRRTNLLTDDIELFNNIDGEAPVFLSRSDSSQTGPTRVIQPEGTTVQLKCLASGRPTPEIRWKKNGKVLSEDEYGITHGPILNIKDLRRSDSGNFTCEVFNKFGKLNATYNLLVTEKLNFYGDEPENTTVGIGQTAILNCRVRTDDVNVRIQWLKRIESQQGFRPEAVILDSEQYEIIMNDVQREASFFNNILSKPLIFKSTTSKHIGKYVCLIHKENMMNYRKAFLNVIDTQTGSFFSTSNRATLIYGVCIPITLLSCLLFIVCCLRCRNQNRLHRHNHVNSTRGSDVLKSSMRPRQPLIHQNAAMIPSTSSGVSNDYLTNSVDSIPVTRQYVHARYGPSTSSDIASLTSSNLYYARVQPV